VADAEAEFKKIADERDRTVARLKALQTPAQRERNRLNNKRKTGVDLTEQEKKDFDNTTTVIESTRKAIQVVNLITIQAMDDSDLLKQIKSDLNKISGDLKKTMKKLDHIVKIAQTAAQVTSALVKIVERLTALLAKAA
jgi:hypothetical protein